MALPGSDQYAGITPFQEVIPLGALPLLHATTCGEVYSVGMGRLTLLCQYIVHDTSTGVYLTIWLSPYSSDADAPAGESVWWPITVIATSIVEGCVVNSLVAEVATFTYCARADTLEPFTLDISLPSHAQRIRVCAEEMDRGLDVGWFGCYALLSLDSGGEFGWTLKAGTWTL